MLGKVMNYEEIWNVEEYMHVTGIDVDGKGMKISWRISNLVKGGDTAKS